jgi:hypothetical protein
MKRRRADAVSVHLRAAPDGEDAEFIDFIFHEVWCKAPIGLVFHPDLFDANPDLQAR